MLREVINSLVAQCGTGEFGRQPPRLIPEGSYRTTQGIYDVTNSNLSAAWNGKPVRGVWRLSMSDTNFGTTGTIRFVLNTNWTWRLDIEVGR